MSRIRVSDELVKIYLSGKVTPKSFYGVEDLIEALISLGKRNFILDTRRVTHIHYEIGKSIDRIKRELSLVGGELRVVCDNEYLLDIMRFATGEPCPPIYPSIREARKNL
jgi:hypothetical protein